MTPSKSNRTRKVSAGGKRRTSGGLSQLKSGNWQGSYWDPYLRKRRYATFRLKGDANAWIAKMETHVRSGEWVDPNLGKDKFGGYAETWLAQRHDLRPRTKEDYESILRLHLLEPFGSVQLARIERSGVRQWYADMSKEHPGRAHKAYRLLRTILNTAVSDGLIVRNPCQVRGASQDRPKERAIPTVDEVDSLASEMPDRLRLLVLFAAWCGLRRGELLALRRCDVDVRRRTIRVERSANQLADGSIQVGPPKTDAGRREVHFPSSLDDVVQEHLDQFVASDPESLIFTGVKGGPLRPHVLQKAWNKARSDLGVGYRLHDLRHFGATLAAETGASTRELMRRIGHSSPQAALIYQHASEARDEEIAEAMAMRARTSR